LNQAHEETQLLKLIGANIKALRKAKGLSQEKLAELTELTSNFISLVECGDTSPSIIKLFRMAQVLEVDVTDLLLPIIN